MKQNPSSALQKDSPLLLLMAIYQIAGGVLGLGLFLKMIPQLQNPSPSTWVGIGIAALLYSFSIFCGFSLLQRKRKGYTFSLVNQVLQVIGFGVAGLAYNYVSGIKIGVGIDFLLSWVFKFRFSLSSFSFSFGTNTGASFVTVNVLALFLIYFLERVREEASKK
ncbi:hypothetical protein [Rufibacter tibetensis]|uniref:Uncharacterized protein n=1 Tax=Rufibacter tibetensis TaxID=512763 RepID=A0A0P0CTS8_9BACT|nr:hypothetical protein [Rufibacter tibetensis]ALJ00031.1 hypothetical protein DC20_14905 [Rufibacter tibetensis]